MEIERMTSTTRIAVIVGSLRKESFNRKIALALAAVAPAGLEFGIVEIGDLPLYNEDIEKAPPAPWTTFRNAVKGAGGLLFVTAEYNRSVPGCLKNALDVGSRPYGASVWSGKPAGVISSSPGAIGGFGANHHLRQSLVFLDVPVMQQPEAYLAGVGTWFDPEGKLVDDKARAFLTKFAAAFGSWVAQHPAK
jgi:chromate reductase